jgi:hypothetical protein
VLSGHDLADVERITLDEVAHAWLAALPHEGSMLATAQAEERVFALARVRGGSIAPRPMSSATSGWRWASRRYGRTAREMVACRHRSAPRRAPRGPAAVRALAGLGWPMRIAAGDQTPGCQRYSAPSTQAWVRGARTASRHVADGVSSARG